MSKMAKPLDGKEVLKNVALLESVEVEPKHVLNWVSTISRVDPKYCCNVYHDHLKNSLKTKGHKVTCLKCNITFLKRH